jgi:hypothetical protein
MMKTKKNQGKPNLKSLLLGDALEKYAPQAPIMANKLISQGCIPETATTFTPLVLYGLVLLLGMHVTYLLFT